MNYINTQTAEKVLSLSRDLRADAAEIFFRAYTSTTIEVKDQKVDAFDRARDIGAGLRVIINGRLGFAFTTDLSEQALLDLAQAAVKNAQNTQPDEFYSIPERSFAAYPSVEIYDPEIVSLADEEMINRVMLMERASFDTDPRIKRIRKAAVGFSESETLIMNTNGAKSHYRGTTGSSSIEIVAEDKGDSQAGSDFDMNRFYRKLLIEEVGIRAARRAIDLLGARQIGSVKAPVILEAEVAGEFLSIMSSGFSSENVQKKKSLFIGKLDKKIASSVITVYDDGLLPGGLGSAPSDDETVPMRKKTVVERGMLAQFLYNTYTASKDKTTSTGNGMRGGFKGVPGVGVTNLYIEPGQYSLEELVDRTTRGLLVTEIMGAHTANPISGDFSVGATGFWIENGGKSFPVREITIAGNILDFMKGVDIVGNDLRFFGRIGSPSIRIEALSIGGR